MLREYGGIPSQARLLIYLSFVPNVAIGFIYTDLSYFLPKFQGIGAGIPITVMGVTLVVLSFPFGIIADRVGRIKMLVLGNICASLSLVGFALVSNYALVLLIAVLEGTGEAAYAVSFVALIADKSGDEKRTPAFSLLAFIGWVAGALGGFIIYSVDALHSVGLSLKEAHVVLFVVIGILSLSMSPFVVKIGEESTRARRREILPRKSWRVIAKYGAYSVIIAVGAGLFVPLMAFWFSQAYGVSDDLSGLVLGLTSLLTAGVVFVAPWLARKMGLVKATVLTQAASTIFMVVLPSAPSFGVAASIYIVRVFLMNLSNPLTQSLIMGLVSPDERGMAAGVSAAIWRLPNALSASVGYGMMVAGLLALPFYYATVLYVVGIGAFWFMFKDAKLPEEASRPSQPAAQSSNLDGPKDER
ncbi:MAG TPA: MFS transporter [Nitrososphaerales archaeon]|nr:MFS transporter [Nitrososphaerales archaeon]